MPIVSIFFGIVIRLYHGDPDPRHFHATYGEFEVIIEIMKLGNKISKILSVGEDLFRLKLKFTDGKTGEVDLSSIFAKPKNCVLIL